MSLIVEDDFLIAAQLEATLREAGFESASIAVSGAKRLSTPPRNVPCCA